jgi:GntR family transcriptional regulator/MocR family aminotransferase
MEEDLYGRYVRRMRLIYVERAAALEQAIVKHLDGLVSILSITMGIDATVFLPSTSNDASIARQAIAAGLETRPLCAYAINALTPGGCYWGFAPFERSDIDAGVRVLAKVPENARSRLNR